MRNFVRLGVLVLVVTCSACGSSGGEATTTSKAATTSTTTTSTTTTTVALSGTAKFCRDFEPIWQDWYHRISTHEELRSAILKLRSEYSSDMPPASTGSDIESNINRKLNDALSEYADDQSLFGGGIARVARDCHDFEPTIAVSGFLDDLEGREVQD